MSEAKYLNVKYASLWNKQNTWTNTVFLGMFIVTDQNALIKYANRPVY